MKMLLTILTSLKNMFFPLEISSRHISQKFPDEI